MRILAGLLLVLAMFPVTADPVDDVRATETAFAKAFADRDKDAFFAFVLDDATFLSPRGMLRGKEAVVAAWSVYFDGEHAPFSWRPQNVAVSADGTLGLSNGPVFDPAGKVIGGFQSTWRKQDDGSWRILFDGSAPAPATMRAVTP